jgi:diguanylate cyclase (GGDEF)-like protein
MRESGRQISSSSSLSRQALISATARLLAADLSLDDLFKQLASLLEDAFDAPSVQILLAGDAPRIFSYGFTAAYEHGASITLPLKFHAIEIGSLRIVRKIGRPFSAADIECLETFALYVAARLNEAMLTSQKDHYAALAGIDPLTGIPSRREFNARYDAEWSRGVRQGGLLSVLMIDVDFFKQFNDHHGHIAGDACLLVIAQTLAHCIARPGDTVARFGGEEFAVILPQTDNAGAVVLAEKMRSAVASQRIVHDGAAIGVVTISVGVATQIPLQSGASTDLLEQADVALYSAKQAGRNKVVGEHYLTEAARAGKPPIRSNLPAKVTTFFGRSAELDAIECLSDQTRSLTITGIAGIGKTCLAIQFATTKAERYPDGVWFIDIARITDAALVVGSVMYMLGHNEIQGKQPAATLVERIGDRRMLIVLDNCERLIEECAALAEALLRKCPKVSIIATCRQPLGIVGEITYRVPQLALHDAADLFVARATKIDPGFEPNGDDRALVDTIVARLCGIPMAIELAAARLKVMTVSELDARLDDRFPALIPRGGSASSHEHILSALVDWIYSFLDEAEKRYLRQLAVFPGDFTIEASTEVCREGSDEQRSKVEVLSTLVDKAFLLDEKHRDQSRYFMFETLREYCRRLIEEGNEISGLQNRHAAYYLELARRFNALRTLEPSLEWQGRVEAEHHNFRAALEWSVFGAGDIVVGTSLAVQLAAWWVETSHFSEGRYWIDHVIWRTNDKNIGPELHACLLAAAGLIDSRQGNPNPAEVIVPVLHVAL